MILSWGHGITKDPGTMIIAVCMKVSRHCFCSFLFETCGGASIFCFVCFGNIGHKKTRIRYINEAAISVVGRIPRVRAESHSFANKPLRFPEHDFVTIVSLQNFQVLSICLCLNFLFQKVEL